MTFYSITSSARASSIGGTSIALATGSAVSHHPAPLARALADRPFGRALHSQEATLAIRRFSFTSPVLIAVVLALVLMGSGMSAAWAQSQTTYVASSGLDTNSCNTPGLPCQTINGAIAKTNQGGTVICAGLTDALSSSVSIDRSVVIDCRGGTTVQLITINTPGNSVTLRNLIVNAYPSGGIDIIAASDVHIENVFVTQGHFQPSKVIYDHRTGPGNLFISNSDIVNVSGGSAGVGILFVPQAGSRLDAVLDNVRVRNTGYGIAVGTGGHVTIKRSSFAANSFGVEGDPGASIAIDGSTIDQNTTGVRSNFSVRLSNNDFTFNTTAISGAAATFGNNRFSGNSSDGTAPTPVPSTDTK
jgi:hypothetical protein